MRRAAVHMRNLLANWVGYGANIAIIFLLTPYIVYMLGPERYGVLTLMLSLGGYLGLADMGIGMSIGRYVNLYMARKQPEKVNHVINSAIPFFVLAGVVLIGLAGVLASQLEHIFPNIPAADLWQAKLLLTLVAVDVMLQFMVNAIVSIPIAHERFDVRNGIWLVTMLLRAAATYAVLSGGGQLVAMGLVNLGADALMLLAFVVAAKWIDPSVHFGLRWFRWEQFRELVSFAGGALFNIVAQKVLYFTDVLIIGWLLLPSDITVYSLGMSFVVYGRGFLLEIARTFYPLMAKQGHGHNLETAAHITARTTRIIMLFTIPLMAGYITLGRDFMDLWMHNSMDSSQCLRSAQVLLILAVAQTVSMSSESWRSMLTSLGHIWMVSICGLVEATLNVALSVLFILMLGLGIHGVAWGTVVPALLVPGIIIPLLGARRVNMPKRDLAKAVWTWVVATAGACLAGFAIARAPIQSWAGPWAIWAAKAVVAGAVMVTICWFIVTAAHDRHKIMGVFRAGIKRLLSAPRTLLGAAAADKTQ